MVKPTQGIGSTAKSRTALIVSLAAPTTLRTWKLECHRYDRSDLCKKLTLCNSAPHLGAECQELKTGFVYLLRH